MEGFAAGLVAACIYSPLDVIKSQRQIKSSHNISIMQSTNFIFKSGGYRGFYAGLNLGMISSAGFYGVFFPVLGWLKKNNDGRYSFINPYIAGCVGSLAVNPLYVMKYRRQIKTIHQQNITFRRIVRNEGFCTLYKGMAMTMFRNVDLIIQIPIYDYMKDKEFDVSFSAATSRFVATTVTYPFDTVRSVLRGNGSVNQIWVDGLKGMFRGYSLNVSISVLKSVVVFTIFEFLKKIEFEKT